MDKIVSVIAMVFGVFISSCTQIILKKTANKKHSGIKQYLNKSVIIANTVFFVANIMTLIAYRYIQLSTGVLIGALSYVFVPILGYIFLKEKFTKNMAIGTVFIISGVVVCAIGG